MLRNNSIDGTFTGERNPSARGLVDNGFDVAATLGRFLLPGLGNGLTKIWAAVGIVALLRRHVAVLAGPAHSARARRPAAALVTEDAPAAPGASAGDGMLTPRQAFRRVVALAGGPVGLLATFAVLYPLYMLYVRTTTALNQLDLRLLYPAYFPLMILTLALLERLRRLDATETSDPAVDTPDTAGGSGRWQRRGVVTAAAWSALNVAAGLVAVVAFAAATPTSTATTSPTCSSTCGPIRPSRRCPTGAGSTPTCRTGSTRPTRRSGVRSGERSNRAGRSTTSRRSPPPSATPRPAGLDRRTPGLRSPVDPRPARAAPRPGARLERRQRLDLQDARARPETTSGAIRHMHWRVTDTVRVRPRFSVVIPVRDRADVVGRAVASVLAQTFADVEVVVVDDGSTDDSVAAARAVSDGRVRIVAQDAAGPAAARRSGVDEPTAGGSRCWIPTTRSPRDGSPASGGSSTRPMRSWSAAAANSSTTTARPPPSGRPRVRRANHGPPKCSGAGLLPARGLRGSSGSPAGRRCDAPRHVRRCRRADPDPATATRWSQSARAWSPTSIELGPADRSDPRTAGPLERSPGGGDAGGRTAATALGVAVARRLVADPDSRRRTARAIRRRSERSPRYGWATTTRLAACSAWPERSHPSPTTVGTMAGRLRPAAGEPGLGAGRATRVARSRGPRGRRARRAPATVRSWSPHRDRRTSPALRTASAGAEVDN